MKYTFLLIFCLTCFCCVAQEVNDGFVEITLDGKTAYMSIDTGEITSDLSKTKNIVKETSNMTTHSGIRTHVVQKGETLYAISKMHGISVKALLDLNELTSTNLNIGQVLNLQFAENKDLSIPTNVSTSTNTYIIKKGETLYSISKKFGVSISELKKLNNLKTNNLSIGQQLKIK
jgi:LysM repeat protein